MPSCCFITINEIYFQQNSINFIISGGCVTVLLANRSNLQLSGGSQVSQKLDDVLGHGRGSGQMVTGGLESVLIGHPANGVGDGAFGVGEFTLGHGSGFFGLVSDLLLDSALADGDSVLGLVAERVLLFLGAH